MGKENLREKIREITKIAIFSFISFRGTCCFVFEFSLFVFHTNSLKVLPYPQGCEFLTLKDWCVSHPSLRLSLLAVVDLQFVKLISHLAGLLIVFRVAFQVSHSNHFTIVDSL